MSSDAAHAWARVLAAVQHLEIDPFTLAGSARALDVPVERVDAWARAHSAPSPAAERALAVLVRRRFTASEAHALGPHIGPDDRIWAHPPSRRRR